MQKESKYTTMWIRDGILYITYKPIPELDLRAAKKIVACNKKKNKTRFIFFHVACNIF